MDEEGIKLLEAAFAVESPLEGAPKGVTREGWEYAIRSRALKAVEDQFRFGYRNPVWDMAERQLAELREKFPKGVIYLLLLGGHRSSKSEWAASYVVQDLVTKYNRRWWFADATEDASRDNQQRYIERYLPPEYRPGESGILDKRRQKHTKVRFSQSGGFTENALVLPNKSECRFKFYKQELSTLQAVALDGFWGDELLPFEWIEEIEWRLVERNGVFIITFTPYEGWNQTVSYFLDGAEVLDEVEADPELLPGEKVHRLLQCRNERARVLYFHSSDNPVFGNWPGIKAKAKNQSRQLIRMRVYGMVDKSAYAQFPSFNEGVHVVDPERIPREGTNTHIVDPHDGRNWFMTWIRIDERGHWWIYREWPSYGHKDAYIPGVGDPGAWAVLGKAADGDPGPAQTLFGFGLSKYKHEIERLESYLRDGEEKREEMWGERWMDSRYGASPTTMEEGTTTLIEKMSGLGMDFLAASGKMIKEGVDMVADKLYYDKEVPIGEFSPTLGRINEPMLHVSRNCPNTIFALKVWTGIDKGEGACKEPIDNLRYAATSGVDYIGGDAYTWKRF